MTVFKNAASSNHFIVDNVNGSIIRLERNQLYILRQFSHIFGSLEVITIPDLDTVNRFCKFIKTGVLKDIPYADTTSFLSNNYPEYFI